MKYNLKDYVPTTGRSRMISLDRSDPFGRLLEDEIQLVKRWKGQQPRGIAKAMLRRFEDTCPDWIDEYLAEAGGPIGAGAPLSDVLYPKHNSWNELEANLKQITRCFRVNTQCHEFWDRMRSLWRYLPGDSGQRVRRRVYRKESAGDSWEEARDLVEMGMCSLCWRSVPLRRGVQSRPLCSDHKLSPTDSEYRRRVRMKYGERVKGSKKLDALDDRYCELLEPLKNNKSVTYDLEPDSSRWQVMSIDVAWNDAPFLITRLLPHVHSYLLKHGADLQSARSIIRTLETLDKSPASEERPDEVKLRAEFYADCEAFIRFYVEHLIWAEIWLELEANTQRGGRRLGGGHKPKK